MNLTKRITKISAVIFSCLFVAAIAFAQETKTAEKANPRDAYTPDNMPEENYLARFQAIEVSEKLMNENLENIYMLKIIVSNFKDQGWESEYNTIYDDYKKAMAFYYKRQVIYSRVGLEKNKKNISELFKKVVLVYKDQAQQMLDVCADKILNFSLDERNKFDPNRSKTLFQNMMRLWIAYGQIDDADQSGIDGVYKNSIFHLRNCKAYAISILEELDPANSEGKYKVHKADNLNRVLAPESSKSNTQSTTK